jgi:hypothetical protein
LAGLTYLQVQGNNTLSGSVTNLTNLTNFSVSGTGTISGNVTNLTNLTTIWEQSANSNISGDVTNLTNLTQLSVTSLNTLTGSVTNLTNLTDLSVTGSNTLSGSVANLTNLHYHLLVQGSNTITGWETAATNATGICYFCQRGNTTLTSAQVNTILAGFRANSAASHSGSTYRIIDVKNTGNGAPTGQGITDKAYLQTCVTPGGDGRVWTVTTN